MLLLIFWTYFTICLNMNTPYDYFFSHNFLNILQQYFQVTRSLDCICSFPKSDSWQQFYGLRMDAERYLNSLLHKCKPYWPMIEAKSRSPVGSAKQRLYNACEVCKTVAHQEEPDNQQTNIGVAVVINYTMNVNSKLSSKTKPLLNVYRFYFMA